MPQHSLATLQNFFNPVWKKVCDGCHLNRDTLTIAKNNGYRITSLEVHMKGLVIFGSMIPSSSLKYMV
ncbi:MAG TPA: hypothetical protein DDY49_10070 [Paenibacillaceae bacterium]|nr:hypothetical protein [Paenibacillaceae bacterium]